jgi:enoyl-CoA hydratase/carnithine racemase
MDLHALSSERPEVVAAAVAAFNEALDSPDRLPVIAALNGDAVGGGMEVALRCDLVVAADDCSLRLPEVERGLIPGGGGTLLSSRIPLAVAMEVGILGAPMSAARAHELGLVNRLVPRRDVVATAVALAERIARNGPRAVAVTRRLLWISAREGAAAGWEQTKSATMDAELREEMAEGVAAFIDKRAPVWAIR